MSYKLEFSDASAFTDILLSTIQMWCSQEPDVYFISREGLKIYSQKILLSFYSPMLRDILTNISDNTIPGISVPVKAEDISMLLKVIETGLVVSSNKNAFMEVGDVADTLGIAFNAGGSGVTNDTDDSGELSLEVHNDMEEINHFEQQEMEEDKFVDSFDNEDAPLEIKHEMEDYDYDCNSDTMSKFNCDECGKHFTQYEKLNRHMAVHTGERFACEVCGKHFKRENALKKHMKRLHDIDNTSELNAVFDEEFNSVKENQLVDPLTNDYEVISYGAESSNLAAFDPAFLVAEEERKYKCEECHATFKKNAHRERHMLIHTGERPFTCDICTKSFSRKDKLKKHSKIHGNFVGHEVNF